jgi:hypothetical protein
LREAGDWEGCVYEAIFGGEEVERIFEEEEVEEWNLADLDAVRQGT